MGFGSMLKDYLEYYKISQTDFAMRLGITAKHMNEILNGNAHMSLELMHAVSLLTDIDVNLIFDVETKRKMQEYLEQHFKDEKEIKAFLDSYYLKDMNKRNWIKLKDEESFVQNSLDLLEFLNVRSFDRVGTYLNSRILYKKRDDADLRKVYLWIKHCDQLMESQEVEEYQSENLVSLLSELIILRNQKFNEKKLIQLFNRYGIYLVIEDALPGTKIRGCMVVKNTNPAIYLTKYYKEKSSFYFALYHELGHVKSDYNKAKNKIIVDSNEHEDECDTYALNQMIPPKVWREILHDLGHKNNICKKNNIPLCFLYSRLAYEKKISYNSEEYHKYREMID